jgi:hydroxymethylbilane synthase
VAEFPSLRIGTRASPLARWQAKWVAARLAELGVESTLVPIATAGDQQQTGPIVQIGVEGVFTKAIQQALLAGEIDLAVHSLKDLPTEQIEGLALAAVPPRGPSGDVLVCRNADSLESLPEGSVIGTGSLRRRAQLLSHRPDLVMQDIRGNVDTRLNKVASGDYDAIVMAEAGLVRLEFADRITQVLPHEVMLPAVGQGALGIESRADDEPTRAAVAPLTDETTFAAVTAERSMLAALRGGCLAPVGGWGRTDDQGTLALSGVVLSADGTHRCDVEMLGSAGAAVELGESVADMLLAQGAAELIADARLDG